MVNLLTVDLEEWYVAEAIASHCSYKDWPLLTSTVVDNSRRLLSLFERKQVRATWFVLGYCAERHPDLIREIVDCGHEIACHSYRHVKVDKLTPEEFARDTERAIEAIARATGYPPRGYRAPSWSIGPRASWAFEILARLGFTFDSSIFPIKHDIYGTPNGPRHLFRMVFEDGRSLWELPCSTYRILGHNLPLAGGGYLRHSPYWYSRLLVKRLNRQDQPAMVYIHPWELDPDPPRVDGLSLTQRFRTYGSTAYFGLKLDRLLSDFKFATMSEYISQQTRKPIGFERR
jgi:polysaccharide deacetylase family protein (PEP-CTERM system associated)